MHINSLLAPLTTENEHQVNKNDRLVAMLLGYSLQDGTVYGMSRVGRYEVEYYQPLVKHSNCTTQHIKLYTCGRA